MKVSLSVVQGPHSGRVFQFEDHSFFVVGRGEFAHLRLEAKDRYFSRAHFVVETKPPHCRLTDLASTNGTFINAVRVTEQDLQDGDVIQAGRTHLNVMIERTPDDAPMVSEKSNSASDAHVGPIEQTPELNGYRLIREVGRGAIGVVYLAEKRGQRFALKMIQPQGDVSDRDVTQFLREASILRNLVHPAIVRFIEPGEHQGTLFYVMEWIEGRNLDEQIEQFGSLNRHTAVKIGRRVLEGLHSAHQKGYVHRDIKPSNILINRRSAKIADFGMAKCYQASCLSGLTLEGEFGSSLAYTAPEQFLSYHDAVPANDIYSMGAVLYKALSGRTLHEFPERPAECLKLILESDPVCLSEFCPELPDGLVQIIHRCLKRNPDERWNTAQDLSDALLPFAQKEAAREAPIGSVPTPTVPPGLNHRSDDQPAAEPIVSSDVLWQIAAPDCRVSAKVEPIPVRNRQAIDSDGTIYAALGRHLLCISPDGDEQWCCNVQATVCGSPVIGPDHLTRVHTSDGRLHAIGPDGRPVWTPVQAGEPLGWTSPLVDGQGVTWICQATGGVLRVQPTGTPDRRPFFRSMQRFDSVGIVRDGVLYVGAEDGCVYAIDCSGKKGRNIWDHQAGLGQTEWFINSALTVIEPDEIVVASRDQSLYGFDSNGQCRWKWKLPGTPLGSPIVDNNGSVWIGVSHQASGANSPATGRAVCFDPRVEKPHWVLELPAAIESTPAVDLRPDQNGPTWFGSNDGTLYAIDLTGRIVRQLSFPAAIRSTLMIHDAGFVLVGCDDGTLSAVAI